MYALPVEYGSKLVEIKPANVERKVGKRSFIAHYYLKMCNFATLMLNYFFI